MGKTNGREKIMETNQSNHLTSDELNEMNVRCVDAKKLLLPVAGIPVLLTPHQQVIQGLTNDMPRLIAEVRRLREDVKRITSNCQSACQALEIEENQNEKLQKALKFYADEDSWEGKYFGEERYDSPIEEDEGKIARESSENKMPMEYDKTAKPLNEVFAEIVKDIPDTTGYEVATDWRNKCGDLEIEIGYLQQENKNILAVTETDSKIIGEFQRIEIRLTKALEFYANKQNHRNRINGETGVEVEMSDCHRDFGRIARKALKEKESGANDDN